MSDTLFAPAEISSEKASTPQKYKEVLARAYRPKTFAEVVGQDALVRTLTNAIQTGRIAHAFMLTGVRGVGKTTTARIIARALNCIAPGLTGPTITPCNACDSCTSITQDRHVDVMEMDAASRTGVDDIREIIDGVRYAPVSARYKVYIIDEVHMLSKNAFNALLKTLEEPPPHVKFIFATTEIRKVPVTVLSRCQRFDLRRVNSETLGAHFAKVAQAEGATVESEALALIARAADGSVRDGMSLLDQAIALSGKSVTAQQVRDMLGLADRTLVMDLLEFALTAKTAQALDILSDLHQRGADPAIILQDVLDLTHTLTRLKVVPGLADNPHLPEMERVRGGALAAKLSVPQLSRAWQIVLKGLGETHISPSPLQTAEMTIIRLAHMSDMPTPGEVIRQLSKEGGGTASSSATIQSSSMTDSTRALHVVTRSVHATAVAVAVVPQEDSTVPSPTSFENLVKLFATKREGALYGFLYSAVHLVRFEPGRLEIYPLPAAPADLASRVMKCLNEWTGQRWVVAISRDAGQPTLSERDAQAQDQIRQTAVAHPLVQAVLVTFPEATIADVRTRTEEPVAKNSEQDTDQSPFIDSEGDL